MNNAMMIKSGTGYSTQQGSEIYNDYNNNKAFGKYNTVFGQESVSGSRGYYILGAYIPSDTGDTILWLNNYDSGQSKAPDCFYNEFAYMGDEKYYNSQFTYDLIKADYINDKMWLVFNDGIEWRIMDVTSIDGNKISGQCNKNWTTALTNWEDKGGFYKVAFYCYALGQEGVGLVDISTSNIATGRLTNAGTVRGASFGINTAAIGYNCFAEGHSTMAINAASHAEGYNTRAVGPQAHAEGAKTTALGEASHAEGSGTIAKGIASHAEGYSKAIGECSHSEGNSTAEGKYAHSEGNSASLAKGAYSHSESASVAQGEYSHAEGSSCTAIGVASHAEGYGTTAFHGRSHAEGSACEANGYASHAEGCGTITEGSYSHAEGYYTKAIKAYQHVQGKYNIEDSGNKYAHILGNGTADTARSNAHTSDWNGNAWFAGDVKATDNNKEISLIELAEQNK